MTVRSQISQLQPHLHIEWHPSLNPSASLDTFTGSRSSKVWWQCQKDIRHVWDASIVSRGTGRGCRDCGTGRAVRGVSDFPTTHPHLLDEWASDKNTSLDPEDLMIGSGKKAWWRCKEGHEWFAPVYHRKDHGCKKCGDTFRKVPPVPLEKSLAFLRPEIASQWDYEKNTLTPEQVYAQSGKEAHWVCKKGHQWSTPIQWRYQGNGCPYCSGYYPVPGETDLASLRPDIAAQWSSKNTLSPAEVLPSSHKVALWVCSKGDEWYAPIYSRTAGSGCPVCTNILILPDRNDLASLRPDLAAEWSPRNTVSSSEVSVGSDIQYFWKCSSCSHEWAANVYNRSKPNGTGCPRCSNILSRMESEVFDYVSLSVPEEVISSTRSTIPPYELDIYIPSKGVAIEFNGLYWHSEDAGKDRKYHASKQKMCAEKGIQLIQIWEDEWRDKKEVVKKMLDYKLGVTKSLKVYARKTRIAEISKEVARDFLLKNHIQGPGNGSIKLGLFHKNDLVAVALFRSDPKQRTLTLDRYATSQQVVGGHSKIISYVQRNYDFDKIITFADLNVSDGSLYEKTGWIKDGELAPDYRYIVDGQRIHKFNYRLKRFREDPELLYEEGFSEKQLAALNGIPRIWDCGKIRYVMLKESTEK